MYTNEKYINVLINNEWNKNFLVRDLINYRVLSYPWTTDKGRDVRKYITIKNAYMSSIKYETFQKTDNILLIP